MDHGVDYCSDRPCHAVLGKFVGVLELCARKVSECCELNGLICRILDDKNSENDAESKGLTCEVSERSKDSTGVIDAIFYIKTM